MPQEWDDLLQEGSFDGVKFDFVSVKDDYSNDIDSQKFPGRKGTKRKARGRNGTHWDIMAVIIEDDYPQKMLDLINVLDNGGEPRSFVHPIMGETKAACERFTVNHDADDARDSCTITISLAEELIEDLDLVSKTDTVPAFANKVRSLADQVLTALSDFNAAAEVQNSDIALQVQGAVNAASGIADELEGTGEDLSNIAIQARSNDSLSTCDTAVATLADYDSTEKYDLAAAILAMAHALADLAQALIEQRPPLSMFGIDADTNLLALAHALGVDAEELLTLNSFPDPTLIPAGFKVLAYAA